VRRAALVGPTHPAPGGIVHFTAGLAAALAERGDTLVVGWSRRFPARHYPGTIADEVSETAVTAPGEPILDLLDPRTWRRAARRITDFQPDVVVLQWWHAIHAPVVIALQRTLRRTGIPVVVVCHNIEPHETNRLWRSLTRRALGGAGALIVHAAALRPQAERAAPRVPVVDGFLPVFANVAAATGPAGPDEVAALRRRVGAEASRLLLTFGYVRPYKGVEDAIAAMAHLRTRAVLLVAGECWESPDRYRDAAEAAGVADRVVLDFRYVPNDEIPAMFAAADAVVLPYRTATQSAVAALAFAFDRPVVATRAGGLAELVEDGVTGALAPPSDPEALAGAIDRVLADTRDWGSAIADVRARRSWTRYVDLIDRAAEVARIPRRDATTHAVLDVPSRRAKAAKLVAVIERTRPLRGARLLDIGTGSGTIASELTAATGPDGSVTSVDVADVRVTRDGYDFVRFDGERLPFDDAGFDVVVSNHVIEHVGDREAQRRHLGEIARVLVDGGTAYVAVPHRWQLVENHYRLPLLGWLPRRAADAYMRAARRGERYDCRPLGRRELLTLLTDAGFDAHDATGDLVEVTAEQRAGAAGRALAAVPWLRVALRGPLLPTIVAVGRRARRVG
jgi:glycosyltransferase involved in cell wall biosynthesis